MAPHHDPCLAETRRTGSYMPHRVHAGGHLFSCISLTPIQVVPVFTFTESSLDHALEDHGNNAFAENCFEKAAALCHAAAENYGVFPVGPTHELAMVLQDVGLASMSIAGHLTLAPGAIQSSVRLGAPVAVTDYADLDLDQATREELRQTLVRNGWRLTDSDHSAMSLRARRIQCFEYFLLLAKHSSFVASVEQAAFFSHSQTKCYYSSFLVLLEARSDPCALRLAMQHFRTFVSHDPFAIIKKDIKVVEIVGSWMPSSSWCSQGDWGPQVPWKTLETPRGSQGPWGRRSVWGPSRGRPFRKGLLEDLSKEVLGHYNFTRRLKSQ